MSAVPDFVAGFSAIAAPAVQPRRHLWLSLLSFCLLRGVAVAVVFSVVLVGGVATLAGGQSRRVPKSNLHVQAAVGPQTFSGMITDSNCGARHSKDGDLSSAECTHTCVRSGGRYTLVDGEKVFYLNGHPRQLEKAAGQRVQVRGTREGDTIQVDSILPQ